MITISRIAKFLLNVTGKKYEPDPNIPLGLLVSDIIARFLMLMRGLFWLWKPVFLGQTVRIRGRRRMKIDRFATIENNVNIDCYALNGVVIGSRSRIGSHSVIRSTAHLSVVGIGLVIGHDSGIGEFSYFGCAGGVWIGDNVIMGQYVSFHAQEHIYDNLYILIREQGVTQRGIRIGSNVWVGAKVTFLDGAEVGSNSVVAAGAVVKGHFPAGSVIGGVPARLLKTREDFSALDTRKFT